MMQLMKILSALEETEEDVEVIDDEVDDLGIENENTENIHD